MTEKILKYRLVTAHQASSALFNPETPDYSGPSPEKMEAYIQRLIDEGWQPYGYPSRIGDKYDFGMVQAMVIYEGVKL